MKVWLNGQVLDKDDAKLSVYDHATLYGDGVFEGIRIYGGKIFQSEAHLNRLFDSAKHIRLAIPCTKQELHEAMTETIRADERTDGYIRLVVTRGAGTLGLSPFKCPSPTVFIIVDDILLYPREMYEDGMAVIIAKTVRISPQMLDPRVKSLNYLNNILAKIAAVDAGVPEALMLNARGNIAEGTGENVFIVSDGEVITPPREAGMLVGVTRGIVIHLARRLALPLVEKDIRPDDLYAADECFLTGTAAEVIAVTRIDGTPIGGGKVGPIARRLMAAFREFIAAGEAIPYP
ncbi:MAG TPA: branched-chain-amino-acid transaminase [Phycisphaerae bacterium]|nr:branched-chain-amino-acid transaminase [Phycisphaerae bacterium]